MRDYPSTWMDVMGVRVDQRKRMYPSIRIFRDIISVILRAWVDSQLYALHSQVCKRLGNI